MNKTIYALGFFDGVHIGHAALLHQCQALARQAGFHCGVVTFTDHPDTLVFGVTPSLINTAADRERLLTQRFGMDRVVGLPFDEAMRAMPWQDFLQLLQSRYDAAGFVCGEDFRFGSQGLGSGQRLAEYCIQAGLPWAVVPEQSIGGIRVSSTYIRSQIACGDMETAVRFLGHPHILTGRVVHGHQLGRRLGIPTANLTLPPELVPPRYGVYICRALVDDRAYPAVTNIGTRPTVDGQGVTVEPWILNYDGDLYDREITLEFYRFLRPEQKFPSLEALTAEIHRNAQQVRDYLKQKELLP